MGRRVALLVYAIIALVGPAGARPEALVLDPQGGRGAQVRVRAQEARSLTLSFTLATLDREEVLVAGERFQRLSLPGGGLAGVDGRAGLPTLTRFVAVDDGAAVKVSVLAQEVQSFPGLKPFPVQPDEADSLWIDRAYYDGGAATVPASPVLLGDPAVFRDLRVRPVTFCPVDYDPVRGELRVIRRLELRLDFGGADSRAAAGPSRGMIPESFERLYQDVVLDYARSPEQDVGPGAYLIIYPDVAGVREALEPLVDWRRRQGRHVVMADTGSAGQTAAGIKSFIQNAFESWDPPLEFVVLAGDANGDFAVPCWYETVSGYNGEGDHYYSTLAGDDMLADVHVGRLSYRDLGTLTSMVGKIVTYETAPPLVDAGWFTRASLMSDPFNVSGISTVHVNQWLKTQLLAQGYTQIDTIFSGNYPVLMQYSVNQGIGVFGYRGYVGMSGITAPGIMALANGGELPFAVIVTCGTGSFSSDSNCRSEAWLRAPEGGGIGAVGTATLGTHTRYNDCYYCGVWEGALNGGDHSLGSAHTRGKLELYGNYQLAEPSKVEIWSVWNNLMGDPATDLWMSPPAALDVTHPALLPPAANAVPVSVTAAGEPVAGARVALFKAGEVEASAVTDAVGQARVPLGAASAGELLITVTGHDLAPYLGSIILGDVPEFAALAGHILDDDASGGSSGNGDGILNPGEKPELYVALRNPGSAAAAGVTAILSCLDPCVSVIDSVLAFGDIPPGGVVWSAEDFNFALAADAPDGHVVDLAITARSGDLVWSSLLPLVVRAPAFAQEGIAWDGPGGELDPGESGALTLTLRNLGHLACGPVTATLHTESPWIFVSDPDGAFGSLAPGEAGDNLADPFALSVSPDCFPGHLAVFSLTLSGSEGTVQSLELSLPVGAAQSADPVGPDAYGYYAFDDSDTSYAQAPVYDWVEIDPGYGGAGTDLGLGDFGSEQDDSKIIELPFGFRYYGRDFQRATICSNGWMVMGDSYLVNYRNWSIPSAGSPDAMIAPFWDNLYQSGGHRVFTWFDAANSRFIIQWSRLRNEYNDAAENFQVILYDPIAHPTPLGDGEILMQYETVNNSDFVNGFATVGLQDLDGRGGLLYGYWDRYAAGAAPLSTGRAIRFLPLGKVPKPGCTADPLAFDVLLPPGGSDERVLSISNSGEAGSLLRFTISKVDPDIPERPRPVERSMMGSTLSADAGEYYPNSTMEMTFTAFNGSLDAEWIKRVEIAFPDGVIVEGASNMIGGGGGQLVFQGGTGNGATAVWDSGTAWGLVFPGEHAAAVVDLSFGPGQGNLTLYWTLIGDAYGGPPHAVGGEILLLQGGPAIRVLSPNGGESWNTDEEKEIRFSAQGGPSLVDIDLYRHVTGQWETLVSGLAVADGRWLWWVTGPAGQGCRLRVTDSEDPAVADSSDADFSIGRSLAWLVLSTDSGELPAGGSEEIGLSFETGNLSEGQYEAELSIAGNGGPPLLLPVRMRVSAGGTSAETPPEALALAQNHPNPFNPRTIIGFGLPEAAAVRLEVFDVSGRRVAVLIDKALPAGRHAVIWDGRDQGGGLLPSGVYVYRLESKGESLSRKLILLD